ncbi:hypothetical protein [Aeromonas media]|uniref:hypothetical protein n=1 Tax=Aeromonas media TaxID=651 RepID=UPI003CFF5B33
MCKHLLALSVLAPITLITPAQAEEAASMPAMTDEAMITSAMAAAPVKVGAGATIVAMGADGKMRTLREGSNRSKLGHPSDRERQITCPKLGHPSIGNGG